MNTTMNTTPTRRLAIVILGISIFSLSVLKAETKQTYTGFLGDTPITLRITWENMSGLGSIWGTVSYDGRTLNFSGRNDYSGHIFFRDSDGDNYDLSKSNTSSTIGWKGSMNGATKVTFTRKR